MIPQFLVRTFYTLNCLSRLVVHACAILSAASVAGAQQPTFHELPTGPAVATGGAKHHASATVNQNREVAGAGVLIDEGEPSGELIAEVVRTPKPTHFHAVPAAELIPHDFLAEGTELLPGRDPISVSLEQAVATTIVTSPAIQAVLKRPTVESRNVIIADAAFDVGTFIDSRLAETNDPIGSALTTGNADPRFEDSTFNATGGLRRRFRSGGSLEVSQQMGTQSNNSTFLLPNPQSTSRLEVAWTRPLMQGRGRGVNEFQVINARFDRSIAISDARRQIEDRIIEVVQTYLRHYQARFEYAAQRWLVAQTAATLMTMQRRTTVDASRRQIIKLQSSLRRRESVLVRHENELKNLRARLRALTGDSIWDQHIEPIPTDAWLLAPPEVPLADALATSLIQRPDISAAIDRVRLQAARIGVARNQVKPRLDLLLSGYVAGLNDRGGFFNNLGDQFGGGQPSLASGLLFEMPHQNRAAKARLAREQIEYQRALLLLEQTTANAAAEIEIAHRNIETTLAESLAKRVAFDATQREVEFLRRQLEIRPDPNDPITLLIEDLLGAQESVVAEHRGLLSAVADHILAVMQLRRHSGQLVQLSPVCGRDPVPTVRALPDGFSTIGLIESTEGGS